MVLRQRGCLIGAVTLAAVLAFGACDAFAQPRGTSTRNAPSALPPSGHQTEPVDLNEGKSPAELFHAGCSVCHQSAAGLAKGRRENELTNFLRQHYTSSVQHASALAGYLTSGGRGGQVAAPSRQQSPVERPPAPIGRRTPDDDRKAQEAARPHEREPASKRKPPVARTPPPAAAQAAVPPPPAPEPPAETGAAANAQPVEEKPAAPEIPL